MVVVCGRSPHVLPGRWGRNYDVDLCVQGNPNKWRLSHSQVFSTSRSIIIKRGTMVHLYLRTLVSIFKLRTISARKRVVLNTGILTNVQKEEAVNEGIKTYFNRGYGQPILKWILESQSVNEAPTTETLTAGWKRKTISKNDVSDETQIVCFIVQELSQRTEWRGRDEVECKHRPEDPDDVERLWVGNNNFRK